MLTDADLQRYPSLWDFTVLRMSDWLRGQKGRTTALPFAGDDYTRSFAAGLPGLQRLGALYDESAHLDGGSIDRTMAAERWRVARVMLGDAASTTKKDRDAWHAAALERLLSAGRIICARRSGAPTRRCRRRNLLYATDRVKALALVEEILPKTPESDVAVELRQLRHNIVEKVLGLSTQVTRDGKGALHVSTRNLGDRLGCASIAWIRCATAAASSGRRACSRRATTACRRGWPIASRPSSGRSRPATRAITTEIERDFDAPAPGVGLYLVGGLGRRAASPTSTR